jgi:hypothetical protein
MEQNVLKWKNQNKTKWPIENYGKNTLFRIDLTEKFIKQIVFSLLCQFQNCKNRLCRMYGSKVRKFCHFQKQFLKLKYTNFGIIESFKLPSQKKPKNWVTMTHRELHCKNLVFHGIIRRNCQELRRFFLRWKLSVIQEKSEANLRKIRTNFFIIFNFLHPEDFFWLSEASEKTAGFCL